MARLIAVSIDCPNDAARQTFEEIVSRRRDYLVTKGQGTGAADILLLELNDNRPQHTFAQVRELLAAAPSLEIFLTSSRTDSHVLLEAFRLGVKEFLPQPLTRQDVEPALARFEERFSGRSAKASAEAGRVICVIGARGGVGTSTIATNLATTVVQQGGQQHHQVALLDLDLHGGDLGLFLDLTGGQGIKHLSKDVSRLDETIVGSALQRHPTGVHLLGSGYEGFDEVEHTPGSTMRVLGLLRALHGHVFVDCGHVLEPAVREALDCADQVIVVSTLSLPAIRRAKKLLDVLRAAHYPSEKLAVVVNRYSKDQKDLLAHVHQLLDLEVAGLIPNDYGTANEAINHGKPLTVMAPKTSISQWYLRTGEQLVGGKAGVKQSASPTMAGKKASFLGRCLSGLRLEAGRNASVT